MPDTGESGRPVANERLFRTQRHGKLIQRRATLASHSGDVVLTRLAPIAVFTAAALIAPASHAQIIRPGGLAQPAVWISGSVGYYVPGRVNDGRSQATWDFSSGAQFRGSVEVPVGSSGGYTLGVAGTWTDMPLRYYSTNTAIDPTGNGVDAHAELWSLLGVFHVGSTRGFHQIIEVSGGVIGYRNFRADGGGITLPSPGSSIDFTIGAGYGFGYSLSPRAELSLVQEYAFAFHSRTGLPGNVSGTSRHTNLRLGLRVGLGRRGLVY